MELGRISPERRAGMPMGSSGPAPCRVTVCRDCCCGSPKVTGIDHAGQLERLRQAAPVRVSRCLDACEQANIVVVQPSAAGRAKGAHPVWLRSEEHTSELQ